LGGATIGKSTWTPHKLQKSIGTPVDSNWKVWGSVKPSMQLSTLPLVELIKFGGFVVCPGVAGNLIKLYGLFASFRSLKFKVLEHSPGFLMASGLCEVECEVDFTFKVETLFCKIGFQNMFGLLIRHFSWISQGT
jgi:hypothetical protein